MFSLSDFWYRPSFYPATLFLLPFSWLFSLCITLRHWFYKVGLIKVHDFSVPVIIVGNISVGGTGKTPFVIWLADFLRSQGYSPGIVSRGVGGKKQSKPYHVTFNDCASLVGDEAVLLAKNTQCPVVIGIDRVAAVRELLANTKCDVVISDDGLQHYRLGRSIEIAMVDHVRKFGNERLLPAGPLREPIKRLVKVDFVIYNGDKNHPHHLSIEPHEFVSLKNQTQKCHPNEFPNKKIHAVAGIGHPEKFFNLLRAMGFEVIPHAFPDHHLFRPHEINFNDAYPILMTEKDAVKCQSFASESCWYLSVTAKVSDALQLKLMEKLNHHHSRDRL